MIEILHMQHAKEEPVSITALFFSSPAMGGL